MCTLFHHIDCNADLDPRLSVFDFIVVALTLDQQVLQSVQQVAAAAAAERLLQGGLTSGYFTYSRKGRHR